MFVAIFSVLVLVITRTTADNNDCTKAIPDYSITASTWKDDRHKPQFAKLNANTAWCSRKERSPYLQISLSELYQITGIATQGSRSDSSWVAEYEIRYTTNSGRWKTHKASNGKLVFEGNSSPFRASKNIITDPWLVANAIRIYPTKTMSFFAGSEQACLRVEIYGCKQPASCRDPGTPDNGEKIEGIDFGHGKHVRFACNKGFKLVGKSSIHCSKGEWSGVIPQCKALCADPGIPTNGKIEKGGHFYDGEAIRFSCKPKFNLIGSSLITCLAGNWSSSVPVCKAPCSQPAVLQHGSINGVEFGHGRQVTFDCDDGFRLLGNHFLVCNDGIWSADIPQCKALCKDPGNPVNGKRTGDNFIDGQTVAFTCNTGFDLVGFQTLHCVEGKWNARLPECKAKCNDPGSPQNGQRLGTDFGHGKKVRFVCQTGFSLKGSQAIICHDGAWSSSAPLCKASCRDPGHPRNGKRNGNVFGHGKRVTFSCNDGFVLKGQSDSVCISGNWSSALPECKENCKNPGSPANGKMIGNSFHEGQTVAFKCKRGFTLIGPQFLRCVEGQWDSDRPVCKASCSDPGHPKNGARQGSNFAHGQQITFVCNSGFDLEGSSAAVCNEGKWDHSPVPACKGRCKDPGSILNGVVHGTDFRHGKQVRFVCLTGFTLKGSDVIKCHEGKWNSSAPECRDSCGDPGTPKNGLRIGDDFKDGKRVTFACKTVFVLVGQSSSLCMSGDWTSSAPECKAPCPSLDKPANGRIHGSDFRHEKRVAFRCNSGYQIIGASSVTCSDGKWNRVPPVCKGICPGQGRLTNGYTVVPRSQYLEGHKLEYRCSNGFDLFGETQIYCRNRKWNATKPYCGERCRDPGTPQHGSVEQETLRIGRNQFRHDGGEIKYQCHAGYSMVGDATVRCSNGRWSKLVPQCKAKCPDPGTLSNGARLGDTFSEGQRVVFRCHSGFTLIGSQTLRCVGGRWDSVKPLCKASCADPGSPQNGVKLGSNFEHGQQVRFACNRGFTLDGSHRSVCNDSRWNTVPPACRASCLDPGSPRDGARQGFDFRHGQHVSFVCNSGFKLKGSSAVSCSDGHWTAPSPSCNDINECSEGTAACDTNARCMNTLGSYRCTCTDGFQGDGKTCREKAVCSDPGVPDHGSRKHIGHTFDGQIVEFSCDSGFSILGAPVMICIGGKWNSRLPTCVDFDECASGSADCDINARCHNSYGSYSCICNNGYTGDGKTCKAKVEIVHCKKPTVPANAIASPNKDWFNDRERISYICSPGYYRTGFPRQQCKDGNWSPSKPSVSCRPRNCGDPGTPVNGKRLGYLFDVHNTVRYSCNTGFVLDGPSERICQTNSSWSGTTPKCKLVDCGPLPAPDRGAKTVETKTTFGGRVEFICSQAGYKLVGSATRTCEGNGKWSGQETVCQVVTCPDPGTPANGQQRALRGFVYGASVQFTCKNNYVLLGRSRIFCKANGYWSGRTPKCIAPCSNPGHITNGQRRGTDFRHRKTVEYRCNKNYQLAGARTLMCILGKWNKAKPTCTRKGKGANLEPI